MTSSWTPLPTALNRTTSTTASANQYHHQRHHAQTAFTPHLDDDDNDSHARVEAIRTRVRQCIHERVKELEAQGASFEVPRAIGMESRHLDVVETAAQILGRHLEQQDHDSLELSLVYRMLVKEGELQALQRQRCV